MRETETESKRARSTASTLGLDDLSRLGVGELTRMYREARAPSSLEALSGAPASRMLTVIGPLGRGPARALVARLAAHALFPWRGKRFEASAPHHGQGINRVLGLGEKFRFQLRYDDSVLDGGRCVLLDYDLPENPWVIRQIRDELREVRPGLFLGPALLRTRTEPKLVLYFAVDLAQG
jgi:hypothetical protein